MSTEAIALLLKGVVAVVLAGLVVLGYHLWSNHYVKQGDTAGRAAVQSQWDVDKIQRDRAEATALAKARKEEQTAAELVAKNAKVEYANQQVQAVAVARAAGVSSGMSRGIESLNAAAIGRGLPTAASCPAEFVRERDDAIFARQLLGSCSVRYQELASTVDGYALKLSTALSYIAVVAPTTP